MQLSGELFKRIISQLKGSDNRTDQRAEPRVGLRNEVSIYLLRESTAAKKKSHVARVRDLSTNGIGLVSQLFLPVGALFAIRLPVYRAKPIVVIYKVTHSEVLEEDMFTTGGRLVKIQFPEGFEGGRSVPRSRLRTADQAMGAKRIPGRSTSADAA
jgi:hypothetical protein